MRLTELLKDIDCKVLGNKFRNITHLTNLAQDCDKNSIYFCLNSKDNILWIDKAIQNGCRVVVTEQSIQNNKITQIVVSSARKAMSAMASTFYNNPAKKLKIIGVTGTNGKTTTTFMIAHIISLTNKTAIVGTNGVYYDNKKIDTNLTTPDPITLHKLFADMVENGIEYVVMEISAHAIYYQKLWGIMPDIIAFTNLSQDHLDFFENMDNYFNAKLQIFKEQNYKTAIICTDTPYGNKIAEVSKNCITCSTNNNSANIFATNITHTSINQTYQVFTKNASGIIKLNMLGEFNIQNSLVAISVCLSLGLSLDQISSRLETLNGVSGRFECYNNGKNTIIVDFAHTPDGLQNLLKTAKQVAGKNKVISVFGCGGNRDSQKRELMGAISEKFADYTIITTDNPRFEDNYAIAQDIAKGFNKNKWQIVLDRGQAVRVALDMCHNGDIVVLAGKGAENYTQIKDAKIEGTDKELVQNILNIK